MLNVPDPEKRDSANENVAMSIGQPAFAYIEQDHLAHIQSHLDFAKDPILGANPMIAPAFIPQVMEHIKQHLTLWYLNRMNGYVHKSLGKPVTDYDVEDVTPKIDKLFALAGQHVNQDSVQTFQQIMPIIQQMMQQMQQFQPKPPMTPEAQVLMDTSMAETQRRAQRDQADVQLEMQKHQDDMALAQEELQLKMAIAQGDNETKERIESARLTRDAVKLQNEQTKTALTLTSKQGGPYGYQ
jgi:hypothetical protein